MHRRLMLLLALLSAIMLVQLACGLTGGGEEVAPGEQEEIAPIEEEDLPAEEEDVAPAEEGGVSSGAGEYDTVFPLPDDVQNFMGEGGEGSANFQTSLMLEETIDFYRAEFEELGLAERPELTTITDAAFSMVFDGWPNGRALVIQGVDLGGGLTNINIRFEDL